MWRSAVLSHTVWFDADCRDDQGTDRLVAAPSAKACRCRVQDGACWPEQAEWAKLNASLRGAVIRVPDELESCLRKGTNSTECAADLGQTDGEPPRVPRV